VKVWLDTDLGTDVDDALALAYALRHPDIELVGVSTVFGDVALRSAMVSALLELAGRGDIPVLTGLGKPMSDGRDGVMLGHEGRGLIAGAAPIRRVSEDDDREARIEALATAVESAGADWLVAIGPMTNIGVLADAGVSLPRLAVMGGKLADVQLAGMMVGIEEWNWFCDPLAVQKSLEVQARGAPRIVPVEITWQTELGDGDVQALAKGDALSRALAVLSEEWLGVQAERLHAKHPRVALHDPLTLATLVEDTLCSFSAAEVEVNDAGATKHLPGGAPIEAAVAVDVPRVREHLMETWLR
jgi:purine nucleosidase